MHKGCRGGSVNETYPELELRFTQELHGMLGALGKQPMHWHDIITDRNVNLSLNTLIEVWDSATGQNSTDLSPLSKVLKQGYSAVYAGSFYLDHLEEYWDTFYPADPTTWADFKTLPADAKARLVGLESCMWGETIDATNAIAVVWPRVLAMAERGWSSANTSFPVDGSFASGYYPGSPENPAATPTVNAGHQEAVGVLKRINAHRCRMVERGVAASPPHFGQAVGDSLIFGRAGLCPQDIVRPE